MKPQFRFRRVFFLPGIPGIDGLCFTAYESPVNSAGMLFMKERQYGREGAAYRPGHVFRADQRPPVALQELYLGGGSRQRRIAMKTDDIGMIEHEAIHWVHFCSIRPVTMPGSHRKRLGRVHLPRP